MDELEKLRTENAWLRRVIGYAWRFMEIEGVAGWWQTWIFVDEDAYCEIRKQNGWSVTRSSPRAVFLAARPFG